MEDLTGKTYDELRAITKDLYVQLAAATDAETIASIKADILTAKLKIREVVAAA